MILGSDIAGILLITRYVALHHPLVKTQDVVYGGSMKSRLKQFVPLSVRQEIKRQLAKREDRRNPITAPRVPPRANTLIGGGEFVFVGDEFFGILKRHGLMPDMKILDVGCGQGRMARPLVDFLDKGEYTGFDISKASIDWSKANYSDVPNFTFEYAPVFNARYNKSGDIKAKDHVFPYADNQFDMVFLTSVFTHMFADDIENYLSQIARVLKPGGKCLITWFLINDGMLQAQKPFFDFRYDFDKVSKTTTPKNPESALAFDEAYVRRLYSRMDLNIEAVEYGTWARPDSEFQLQDMVIGGK